MLRAAVWTLRQKRYARLAVVFFAVALVCIGAGTFELHRYAEKRHDNHALTVNAAAPAVPLTEELLPLTGRGAAPATTEIRFRTVTTSGTYLAGRTILVDNQSQRGKQGFYVLTPLRTSTADLLVVRGFVAETAAGRAPASIAQPPTGTVHVTGRLQTATPDIDPAHESSRLGRPVFQGWLSLNRGAPGTAGLRTLPKPGLANPTGGATQWQLLSYVVQWWAFAILALLAPFLFARSEVRASRLKFLGIDEDEIQFDALPDASGETVAALAGSRRSGELVARGESGLAPLDPAAAANLARAQRLADRYGRPLGPDPERALRAAAAAAAVARSDVVRDSTRAAHRAGDEYHARYNDYLWQLALADGNIPDVVPRTDDDEAPTPPAPEPRVIEGDPADE